MIEDQIIEDILLIVPILWKEKKKEKEKNTRSELVILLLESFKEIRKGEERTNRFLRNGYRAARSVTSSRKYQNERV